MNYPTGTGFHGKIFFTFMLLSSMPIFSIMQKLLFKVKFRNYFAKIIHPEEKVKALKEFITSTGIKTKE